MFIILLFSPIFCCTIINSLAANNYQVHNDSKSYIDMWEEDERVHVIKITNNGLRARTILVPNFKSEVYKDSGKSSSEKPILHNYETIRSVQNTSTIVNNFDKNVTPQVNRSFLIYVTHKYNGKNNFSNETSDVISQYNNSIEFLKQQENKNNKFDNKSGLKNLLKNESDEVNQPLDTRQKDQDTKKLAKCEYYIIINNIMYFHGVIVYKYLFF